MSTSSVLVPRSDLSASAAAGFLARYREPTLRSYRQDLRVFGAWCTDRRLDPLSATRGHIELYIRDLERRGYAAATIGRRVSTVAGFFKYAVIDGYLTVDPTQAVTRPRVPWEGQHRTVLHPLEYAAVLTAARRHSPTGHALVALLGMIGLRVSEATAAAVTDIRYESGYEILHVVGKGAKPADIPLPIPVLRAIRLAVDGRMSGPILVSRSGARLSHASAARLLRTIATSAGVTSVVTPHALRRTFCTAGLVSGVPLRDMQYAMRHADARTTLRYDMAKANLDRHAAHAVAAYLAGMAIG